MSNFTLELVAAREAEIARLGERIAVASGQVKYALVSELLAFLGFIHSTPEARHRWRRQ